MESFDDSTIPKDDEIIDRLYLASQNSPMTVKNFRLVFKFNQEKGRYEHQDYNMDMTKEKFSKSEIRDIFDDLHDKEDCSSSDMSWWTMKRLMIFIVCIFTLLMCVPLYLIIYWQADKDKKQLKRVKRIQRYLDGLNLTKYKRLGWNWKVGKWGGWIECSREVKEFMMEEYKRLALENCQKSRFRESLNSVPTPIDNIRIDNIMESEIEPKIERSNTFDNISPTRFRCLE